MSTLLDLKRGNGKGFGNFFKTIKNIMETTIQNLFAIREYLTHQLYIKMISVAKNGTIKIVYNAGHISEREAEERMERLGVKNYKVKLDCRSESVFVTIKN